MLCAVPWLLAAGLVPLRPAVSSERLGTIRAVHEAEVLRIIDGDTIDVMVFLLPGLTQRVHVRLAEVDMPELRAACAEQRQAAQAAKQALEELLTGHQRVGLREIRPDKYGGRLDAIVELADGRSVADSLRDRFIKRACPEKEENRKNN